MPYMGELAAIGTSLCFSFGSILFTFAGREVGSGIVNRTRLLVAAVLVMLWHLVAFGQALPLDAAPERWFWLGLSGFVGLALGDAFLFQAFVLVGPRLSMFLGETLALLEVVGIGITIAGIMLVIAERGGKAKVEELDRRRYIIGLLCGLGGAVGQASGLTLSKLGLSEGFPALSGNLIRLLTAMVIIWIVAGFNRQIINGFKVLRVHPRALMFLTGGAILGPMLGVWFSLIAVQNTSVGVASTLSSLMPIFLIPISYVVFKERVSKQAIIGTLVAFVGMVLLFV
jgi:drug/metabolite transporter (DMT)-like permease